MVRRRDETGEWRDRVTDHEIRNWCRSPTCFSASSSVEFSQVRTHQTRFGKTVMVSKFQKVCLAFVVGALVTLDFAFAQEGWTRLRV